MTQRCYYTTKHEHQTETDNQSNQKVIRQTIARKLMEIDESLNKTQLYFTLRR